MPTKKLLLFFCCIQAVGALSLPFANVHSNVLALLLVAVCLFPGTIIFQLLPEMTSSSSSMGTAIGIALAISINAVVWYAIIHFAHSVRRRHLKR